MATLNKILDSGIGTKKGNPMLADYPIADTAQISHASLPRYAGLIFDLAGLYPYAVHGFVSERRSRRVQSVEEAMRSDAAAIAGDMRRALDQWAIAHE